MMKSFLIFTILSLQLSLGFAAEEVVNVEKPIAMEAVETKTATATQTKAEDQIPLNIETVKSASSETPASTRVLLTGVIIASLLTGAYYFVRKYKVSNTINKSNMQIKVLSQHYLGPKKSLAIIRVAGESILVGVTDTNISMIKSLSLIDDEVPSELPQNFADTMKGQVVTQSTSESKAPTSAGATAAGPMTAEELEEEFSFSGLKDSVSKKLKSMRSI